MKLLSIVDECSCCRVASVSELDEIKHLVEVKEVKISQELVDKYNLEKTPALVLFSDNDELLGKLYGYQPAFILEQFILDKGGK